MSPTAIGGRDNLRHPGWRSLHWRIYPPAGAHPAGYLRSEPDKTVVLCPEAACAAATVVVSPTALSRCTVQQYDGICKITVGVAVFPQIMTADCNGHIAWAVDVSTLKLASTRSG